VSEAVVGAVLGATGAAAVTVTPAVTVAALVAAATAVANADAVTPDNVLGVGTAARCTEACGAAPDGGSISPVEMGAATAFAKGVWAGSASIEVRSAKGNDATGVGSHVAGSGTRYSYRSSGFLARRPTVA